MSRVLFGYGALRGVAIRNRKVVGLLVLLVLIGVVYIRNYHSGLTKIRSMDDYYGDDLDLFESIPAVPNYDEDVIEKLAIGETGLAPLDENRVVENLGKIEEKLLAQANEAQDTSILDDIPVFDKNGNEIGLRFLALSDWGGKPIAPYTTQAQIKVSKSMAVMASKYDCSFVLSLGDNFCDNGVTSTDDTRFENTFEHVFTHKSLRVPWYVVAGDADYRGNVSAQIQYSDRSSRWSFKKKYYDISAKLSTFKNVSVDFVMIDTVQLCGRLPLGGVIQPLGPDDVNEAEEQWKWIERTLKNSVAEYLIVGGHYPVYSGGKYGSTKCLVDRLAPMLKKYHVSAYFGGHDHSVQHIEDTGRWTVHHFVVGASSDEDDKPDHLDSIYSTTRYFWTNHLDKSTGAFAYCDVRKDRMSVDFIHSDFHTVLYTVNILPRSNQANRQTPVSHLKSNAAKIPVKKEHVIAAKQQYQGLPFKVRPKPKQQLIQEERDRQQKLLEQHFKNQHAIRNIPNQRRYRGP